MGQCQRSRAPPPAHNHNHPALVVGLSRPPVTSFSNKNTPPKAGNLEWVTQNNMSYLKANDYIPTSPNLEANPIDVVLDEEEEFLGDTKDPGWLVSWEKPAVPLVPERTLHPNLFGFQIYSTI